MGLNEEVELLRNIPLFANIEPSKLKLLAFTSERISYEANQVLFNQGEIGEADITIDSPKGPITVATVGRNDIVGEIAILCDVPRTASVRAKDKLETLVISKELFFQLIMEFPQIAVEIMRELARRLNRANEKLREALAGDAKH